MRKANKHLLENQFSARHNIMTILLIVFIALFLAITPFLRGLMITTHYDFSKNINIGLLLAAITLLMYTLTALSRGQYFTSKLNLVQHLVWLLPLVSFVSQFNSVSLHFAKLNTLVIVFAAFMFIVSYYIISETKWESIIYWIIYGIGIAIVIFGFMNWFNSASLFGLLPIYPDAVWESGTGKRLTSIFQYPNTYSSLLIALGLISIFGAVSSKTWKLNIIFTLPLVPVFVSLILTSSRWGWLSFPFILIFCLPFISWKKQFHALLILLVTGIATLLIIAPITDWGVQLHSSYSLALASKAWGLLLATSVVVTALHLFIQRFGFSRGDTDDMDIGGFKQQFSIPIISIALGIIGVLALTSSKILGSILPGPLAERLSNISFNQHSVLERFTFYRDSLEIFKDYPIIGSGGGGWPALFQMYQSNPYSSQQVHSYYFQLLAERGIVGFAITLLVYLFIFTVFIKTVIRAKSVTLYALSWFTLATTILVTSILDFHLSYAYIIVLLFISLAGMLAHSQSKLIERVNNCISVNNKSTVNKTINIAYFIIAVISIVVAAVNINAYTKFDKALNTVNVVPYNESLELINDVVKVEKHPAMLDLKAQLYLSGYEAFNDPQLLTLANEAVQQFKRTEPYSIELLEDELRLAEYNKDIEYTTTLLEKGTKYFSWNINYYERLALQYTGLLETAIHSNDTPAITQLVDKVNTFENSINSKMDYLSTLPPEQLQGRPFSMSKSIASVIGQSYYLQGQYDKASKYLEVAYDEELGYESALLTAVYYIATKDKLEQEYMSLQTEVSALADLNGLSITDILKILSDFTPVK